jgi:hypothetical protein
MLSARWSRIYRAVERKAVCSGAPHPSANHDRMSIMPPMVSMHTPSVEAGRASRRSLHKGRFWCRGSREWQSTDREISRPSDSLGRLNSSSRTQQSMGNRKEECLDRRLEVRSPAAQTSRGDLNAILLVIAYSLFESGGRLVPVTLLNPEGQIVRLTEVLIELAIRRRTNLC